VAAFLFGATVMVPFVVMPKEGVRMKAIKVGAGLAVFVIVVGLVFGFLGLPSWLSLKNPFTERRVERAHPAILDELISVSEYTAAAGTFSVLVDVERDVRFMPAVLAGERAKMLAVGSVEATVDFSGITDGDIRLGRTGHDVTVTLPAPDLSDVMIDHSSTEVIDRDRGVFDRIGGMFTDSPTTDRDLLIAAERQLADAASTSDLLAMGEDNSRTMLDGLLGDLGYDDVTVVFVAPAATSG
jgi:hypothetical protein